MKINLKETLVRSVRQSSRTSRILFILCVISGLMTLLTGDKEPFFLLTGFLGVMWLSSIALHAFKSGRAGKRNPFTGLIALCSVISALCLIITGVWHPQYRMENEPLNQASRQIQMSLDNEETEFLLENSFLLNYTAPLNGVHHNLIVTDREGNILFKETDWQVGSEDIVYAHLCPSSRSNGDGLLLLTDEKGTVLTALITEEGWLPESRSAVGNELTIEAETPDEKTTKAAPLSEREKIFNRYFPSFGKYIDQAALGLVDTYGVEYINPITPATPDEPAITHADFLMWNGEKITDIFNYNYSAAQEQALIAELSSLTAPERDALKKYIQWLESALETARNPYGDYCPNYVRVLTDPTEEIFVYLFYNYDGEALYPLQRAHMDKLKFHTHINNLGILLIPAIIVFLSFWVFVDAKKRGLANPALWAVLTLIGNGIAWLIYLLIRPQMMVGPTGQAAPRGVCPLCGAKLRNDFIACPGCGILLRSKCKGCGKALENDWSFCPYCASAIVRAIPGEENQAPSENPPATDADSAPESGSDPAGE